MVFLLLFCQDLDPDLDSPKYKPTTVPVPWRIPVALRSRPYHDLYHAYTSHGPWQPRPPARYYIARYHGCIGWLLLPVCHYLVPNEG